MGDCKGVKALLCTHTNCDDFFSYYYENNNKIYNKPANLYTNIDLKCRLEKYIKQIMRFNVYIDAMVKKHDNGNGDVFLEIINSTLTYIP
jgi:hypothetical protein